jgi:hypothetical protein
MNLWTPPYSLVRKISPFCSFQKDEATQINQKNENDRANFFMDDTLFIKPGFGILCRKVLFFSEKFTNCKE